MKKIILSFQYRIKNQYKLTILTEFPSLMTISYFIKTHEFKFKFADYQTNGMDQIAVPTQDWYPTYIYRRFGFWHLNRSTHPRTPGLFYRRFEFLTAFPKGLS